MENKKYLDKVVGSLVRSTKMNYEKEKIFFPFTTSYPYPLHITHLFFSVPLHEDSNSPLISSFISYCRKIFGLTYSEIDYVWEDYKEIILNKIKNGK